MVFSFENFGILIGTKVIMHIDHANIRYFIDKKDENTRII